MLRIFFDLGFVPIHHMDSVAIDIEFLFAERTLLVNSESTIFVANTHPIGAALDLIGDAYNGGPHTIMLADFHEFLALYAHALQRHVAILADFILLLGSKVNRSWIDDEMPIGALFPQNLVDVLAECPRRFVGKLVDVRSNLHFEWCVGYDDACDLFKSIDEGSNGVVGFVWRIFDLEVSHEILGLV